MISSSPFEELEVLEDFEVQADTIGIGELSTLENDTSDDEQEELLDLDI